MGIEASTLGLKPGQWPKAITVDGITYREYEAMYVGEEFIGIAYVDADHNVLQVFND
jgi:hypothetical protein